MAVDLQPAVRHFNTLLWYVGIQGPGWLSDPVWAKPALVIMSVWGVGNWMVIYLAGLQDVPQELYEAAELDGARWWSKTWHLTLPFMSPYILFSVIQMLIGIFQYFTQVAVMTQGGPANSTRMYAYYLYQNAFTYFKMGYASAMAWLLFIFVVILTIVIFKQLGTTCLLRRAVGGLAMANLSEARPITAGRRTARAPVQPQDAYRRFCRTRP